LRSSRSVCAGTTGTTMKSCLKSNQQGRSAALLLTAPQS
jgi:hypothetical protein